MALNFQQVFDKIREIGLGARLRQETQDALRKHARSLLADWADKSAELRDKLERARQLEALGLLGITLQSTLGTGFQSAWKLVA